MLTASRSVDVGIARQGPAPCNENTNDAHLEVFDVLKRTEAFPQERALVKGSLLIAQFNE
jgi:hypothetical protein